MAKIYLPVNINNNNCAYINNNDVIRVFDFRGTNQYITYTDYYINNHYITNTGASYVGNNFNYNCISTSDFTTDYWYRNDILDSLLIFVILFIFIIFIPFKIMSRPFGKWLKL